MTNEEMVKLIVNNAESVIEKCKNPKKEDLDLCVEYGQNKLNEILKILKLLKVRYTLDRMITYAELKESTHKA